MLLAGPDLSLLSEFYFLWGWESEKVRDLKILPLVLKVSYASAGGCILIFASTKGRSPFERIFLKKYKNTNEASK